MFRNDYDQWVYLQADPCFQKWPCAECGSKFFGNELDKNELCKECAKKNK